MAAYEPDESHSCSSSSFGLDNVNLSNKAVHPEQWTLPQEWNMEMREVFSNWKLDVQSQIKYLDSQLSHSLQKYPVVTDHKPGQYTPGTDPDAQGEEARLRRLNSGKMQIGLRRT